MAVVPVFVDQNFNNQTIRNFKVNPLTTAQRLALTLSVADDGYVSWDIDLDSLKFWNGVAWVDAISGAAVGIISGTVSFDFGLRSDTVVSTIATTALTLANFKGISFIPIATSDHSIDDYPFEGIGANLENIVDGISFDLRASSPDVSYGIYSFNYRIIY